MALIWLDKDDAPRDGTWVLIKGEMAGGDTETIMLGRWNPKAFDIGSQSIVYEWQALDDYTALLDEHVPDDRVWDWYADGRVESWAHLPGKFVT